MHDVTIPALGMAMTEAVLTRWHKQPGDSVAAGDVLAEIETDKSVVDLESPAGGTLGPHLVGEGATVPVGDPVVRIFAPGETPAEGSTGPVSAAANGAGVTGGGESAPPELPSPAELPSSAGLPSRAGLPSPADLPSPAELPAPAPVARRAPHSLSPRQRQLARLAAANASGQTAAPPSAPAPSAPASSAPASDASTAVTATSDADPVRARAAIAAQVSRSWQEIPHFAVQRQIDAGQADAALAALRTAEPAATYTDLLLRALAQALQAVVGGSGDVGLAVATPAGVIMPVVRGVPGLTAGQLVEARSAAVMRARNGRLTSADLTSKPLASLSNLGSRGVDSFTGVIAVGQQMLMTVGRIRPRPVVRDGGLHVRPTLIATLNVDHRSFDGDRAADVLAAFDHEFGSIRAWAEGAHA